MSSNDTQTYAERILANAQARKLAQGGGRASTPAPAPSSPAGNSVNEPGPAAPSVALEDRVAALELQNAALWVALITSFGIGWVRRRKQFRVKNLVAERILLATDASSGVFGLGRKLAAAGELGIRAGRPELRMLAGRVVLMDEQHNTRLQLDPRFSPAVRVVEPDPHTEAMARAGMDRLRPWAGKPVVLFNDAGEVPRAVLDAEEGWQSLRRPSAAQPITPEQDIDEEPTDGSPSTARAQQQWLTHEDDPDGMEPAVHRTRPERE